MGNPITFNDYERISDELYYIYGEENYAVIKFTVDLGKRNKSGEKIPFHQAYRYNSDKYIDKNNLITIKRILNSYISFETRSKVIKKETVDIGLDEIFFAKMSFVRIYKWFSTIFKTQRNPDNSQDLIIIEDRCEIIKGRWQNTIRIIPIVMPGNIPGVRMIFNGNYENYFDLNMEQTMAIYYIINSINLIESAQILLNYMNVNINDNSNVREIENLIYDDEPSGYISSNLVKREIPAKKKPGQKSFFNGLDKL